MERFLILGIGSVLAILFIIQMDKGSNYAKMLAGLDGGTFPFHNLYIVGFGWSKSKILKFEGNVAARLKKEASVLYEPRYAEYYAVVSWAGAITYVHMGLMFGFLFAGIFYGNAKLMLAVGVIFAGYMAYYSLTNMKKTIEARTEECELQLAEVVSTMAILLNSGMVLREAWSIVSKSSDGALRLLMREVSENINSGMMEKEAFYNFGMKAGSLEIRKFTSAMLQSMEKGGAELSDFMQKQSSEMWNTKRQKMLQGGEKAATKLLLPIMLIFIGVIIIVITAAFGGTLFN